MFLGESHVDFIEQQMLERGYLDSREMSDVFNLLRSNDRWSNLVNNYLLGLKPPAFDLLYWNSDGTRMARAAHSWYLRSTYVENNLIKPGGRGERSHCAVGRGMAHSATRRWKDALRARLGWSHCGHHQSTWRKGQPLDQRR